MESLRAACKEVRAAIDKGIEAHLEVCGGTRDTPPTPRHEGFVQTPENDGGPGREENRGTAGHQGRERQSAAR